MKFKNKYNGQIEFQKEGFKRMKCPNCFTRFLTETHLGEKNRRELKCRCGTISSLPPPKLGYKNGIKGVYFGWSVGEPACFTATFELN